jgi:hypothetical protein
VLIATGFLFGTKEINNEEERAEEYYQRALAERERYRDALSGRYAEKTGVKTRTRTKDDTGVLSPKVRTISNP